MSRSRKNIKFTWLSLFKQDDPKLRIQECFPQIDQYFSPKQNSKLENRKSHSSVHGMINFLFDDPDFLIQEEGPIKQEQESYFSEISEKNECLQNRTNEEPSIEQGQSIIWFAANGLDYVKGFIDSLDKNSQVLSISEGRVTSEMGEKIFQYLNKHSSIIGLNFNGLKDKNNFLEFGPFLRILKHAQYIKHIDIRNSGVIVKDTFFSGMKLKKKKKLKKGFYKLDTFLFEYCAVEKVDLSQSLGKFKESIDETCKDKKTTPQEMIGFEIQNIPPKLSLEGLKNIIQKYPDIDLLSLKEFISKKDRDRGMRNEETPFNSFSISKNN